MPALFGEYRIKEVDSHGEKYGNMPPEPDLQLIHLQVCCLSFAAPTPPLSPAVVPFFRAVGQEKLEKSRKIGYSFGRGFVRKGME